MHTYCKIMHAENQTIAIDFDGTIVEDSYPDIGKPVLFAFETLQKFQEEGYRLILWTYRSGRKLDEAVAFCEEKGIHFYAVNKSFPEEIFDEKYSRKIKADYFIDDRNIGGLIEWGKIYKQFFGEKKPEKIKIDKKKKGFIDFFKISI